MKKISSAILAVAFVACTGFANAAIITEGPLSYPTVGYAPADWSQLLSFNQFPAWKGTLTSVDITLAGDIAGTILLENQSGDPATLTGTLQAELHLKRPDGTDLLLAIPLTTQVFNASGYDGVLDFGGTSGTTRSGLSANDTVNGSFSAASDLALFTGSGQIDLPLAAIAKSTGSGSGTMFGGYITNAAGTATIVYNYAPATTPEPSTMLLLGSALVAAGVFWRRKIVK